MKKYDNYKDSGVEWFGEIPSHWNVQKLKINTKIKTGYTPLTSDEDNFSDEGTIWVKPDNLKLFEPIIDSKEKVSDLGVKHQNIIQKGSVLLCCIGTIGKFGVAGVDLLTNQQINSITFKDKLTNEYGKYLVFSFEDELNSLANGNVVRILNTTSLGNIKTPIPSQEEQTQIANYLDHKTTQIDTLISKKQQFITLLQEERIAVINQAVTKGLDPKVKMKDSGIEWLGEIPEHWEVSRIKYVSEKIGSGVTPRGGAEVYETSGIPLLRSQNVYFDGFRLDNVAYITTDIHNSMNNSKVLKGDVLLNITGGSIGRCYFVTDEFEDANVNQHVCIVRPNEFILTEYLFYILSSETGQLQIDLCQTGGNREALNFEQLKKFLFALPSIEEQTEIVLKIKKTNKTIDETVLKSLQEIELLKEYKTALISEVVTGKVDVRDVVLN